MAKHEVTPISVAIKAVDEFTAPLKSILSKTKAFGKDSGIANVGAAFGGLGKSIGGAVGAMRDSIFVGQQLFSFASAAAGKVFGLAEGFADYASKINDSIEATGVGAKYFQVLSYAAQQTGSSQEDLFKALKKVNAQIGEAKRGIGPLKNIMLGLKINFKGKNIDQILPQIINAIAKTKDVQKKADLAQKFFGKSGQGLMQMFKDGSKGIEEFGKRAEELGLILDDTAISAGDNLGDSIDDMKAAFKGATNTIMGELAPSLTLIAKTVAELIGSKKGDIKKWAEEFAANLPQNIDAATTAIDNFWSKARPVLFGLIDAFKFVAENIKPIGIALGALLALNVVASLVSVVTAIFGVGAALAGLSFAAPLAGFLAIASVAALAVKMIYDNWEPIKKYFTDIWQSINDGFKTGFIDGILNAFKAANPFKVIADGFVAMVKQITGFDIRAALSDAMTATFAPSIISPSASVKGARDANNTETKITVDFSNMPAGTSVDKESKGPAKVSLNQGYYFNTIGSF